MDRFDSVLDAWESVAPLSTARHSLAAATVSERMYAIGGYSSDYSVSGVVEAYDTATSAWEPCMPMRTARWGLAAAVMVAGESRPARSRVSDI